MMLDALRQALDAKLEPWARSQGLTALPAYTLEEPPAGIDADVACNLPLLLAKPLKKSPRALAEELKGLFEKALPMIEGVSVAGAGFINFRWTLAALQQEMALLLKEDQRYGRVGAAAGQKILIEFVSANPTGPLHVGHGRGAALGDSLALILSHLGYGVTREYYINDAGNQVQMLGESLLARCAELEGKSVPFPENGYRGDYVKDLAKEFVAQAPARDRVLEKAVLFAVRTMTEKLKEDLEAFGVHFDSWFSESSLVQKGLVEKHLQVLADRGHVKEEDGALWFVATGDEETKDKDRVLRKRDGRWTYFATDIAYHADKYERGYDLLIDVWGADHHGYVPRVKGSVQALGYDASKLHVILNQMVALTRNGVPVMMSKRAGEFVTLRDVLDEVGKDACRFFFAMRGPNSALDFDLELAKKHTVENPVYYLQYAHARICSIFRQAAEKTGGGVDGQQNRQTAEKTEGGIDRRQNRQKPETTEGGSDLRSFRLPFIPTSVYSDVLAILTLLKEKEERELMKRLALFPQALLVCAQEDSPHPLANYLMQVSKQFHFFYDHHRVLGDDPRLTQARLALLAAARSILKLGLALLGVSAPESM